VSFSKPEVGQGVAFISTAAFKDWLKAPESCGTVFVASATSTFKTEGFVVAPWGWDGQGAIAVARKSPRALVRARGAVEAIPDDLRPFLLVEGGEVPWKDVAFSAWLPIATRSCCASLADEVASADDKVSFAGPPRLELEHVSSSTIHELGSSGFLSVQRVARWVYDLDREAELRHGLFVQEFARLSQSKGSLAKELERTAETALDGAKIAYGFSIQEMSRDALKGLSDLRKAIVDETQKVAESTRQLALSAAGAEFYALGLLAARLTSTVPAWLIDCMAGVGLAYVLVVLYINWRYLSQQQELRGVWKMKLYRYLTDAEYKEMVSDPTSKAEGVLWIMMVAVLIVSVLTFGVVWIVNHVAS
jgi:hypothetical protein